MANTYTQLYIHVVFATRGRHSLLPKTRLEPLFKYSTGILTARKQKVLATGGMPDHVHFVIGLNPATALSDIIRDLKAGTSGMINRERWLPGRFEWQSGYGAFSCSRSGLDSLCRYVLNQEEHHRRRSFRDEYLDLLRRFAIDCDPRYVFDELDLPATH